jgi:hypothetical protein
MYYLLTKTTTVFTLNSWQLPIYATVLMHTNHSGAVRNETNETENGTVQEPTARTTCNAFYFRLPTQTIDDSHVVYEFFLCIVIDYV